MPILRVIGLLLTLCDLLVSLLGSLGFFQITDLTDTIKNQNAILITFLCIVINIALPFVSINVLSNLFKSVFQKGNITSKSNNFWVTLVKLIRGIYIYLIVYPIVIILDLYTTFIGVSQAFLIEKYSDSTTTTFPINFTFILNETSDEQLAFIASFTIIFWTGHLILAGEDASEVEENASK